MDYDFFDYKYNITGYDGRDFNGIMHVVYILICLILIPLLIRHLKGKGQKKITKIMQVTAIALIIEEIVKISWESYWDIKTGQGFNAGGILPLETCSLFIYTLTVAAFGKGKAKDCALAWMSSIGVLGGVSYILFTNVLKWYPFFTYGAFHSMIFHFLMVFIGLLIPFSGYHRFSLEDINNGFMPQLLMAAVVIPLDYRYNWDYMLLHHAGGIPLVEEVAERFAMHGVPFMTTLMVLVLYYLMGALLTLNSIGIQKSDLSELSNREAKREKTAWING